MAHSPGVNIYVIATIAIATASFTTGFNDWYYNRTAITGILLIYNDVCRNYVAVKAQLYLMKYQINRGNKCQMLPPYALLINNKNKGVFSLHETFLWNISPCHFYYISLPLGPNILSAYFAVTTMRVRFSRIQQISIRFSGQGYTGLELTAFCCFWFLYFLLIWRYIPLLKAVPHQILTSFRLRLIGNGNISLFSGTYYSHTITRWNINL